MRMADRETVCRTLRQLTPDRQWYYLGEAELYLLSCMVADLRKDLVEENHRLREELREMDVVRAENDRLRKTLMRCYMSAATLCDLWDGPCQSTEKSFVMWPCPLSDTKKACVRKGLKRACRKLGIEVDG